MRAEIINSTWSCFCDDNRMQSRKKKNCNLQVRSMPDDRQWKKQHFFCSFSAEFSWWCFDVNSIRRALGYRWRFVDPSDVDDNKLEFEFIARNQPEIWECLRVFSLTLVFFLHFFFWPRNRSCVFCLLWFYVFWVSSVRGLCTLRTLDFWLRSSQKSRSRTQSEKNGYEFFLELLI